jgi:hypothetical protein
MPLKTSQELEQVKAQQDYNRKIKKAENLKIIYAILANKNYGVELIPNCDETAFLEAVMESLNFQEIRLLADTVYQMYEDLNERIHKIQSCDEADLYHQYYTPAQKAVFWNWNGDPNAYIDSDLDQPNAELIQMEAERDILAALSDKLDCLTTIELNQERETLIA